MSIADAETIIKTCKYRRLKKVPKCSLVSNCSPPEPPCRRLKKEQLSPLILNCYVESEKEAFSRELREICLRHSIIQLRGLVTALELNQSLFTTRALVETNPNLSIEIREQIKNAPDENWDEECNQKVWDCFSHISYTTIVQYAKYQAEIYLTNKHLPGQMVNCKQKQTLKFATNVDLSDVRKWKPQLDELEKLPPFLRVKCNDNMLSYVGHDILGMNTVQLYMKVPGSRTPGHQENNNFCSVNINIGPGDCEWFAVPSEYWGVLRSLCEQNDIDYLSDSWWPPDMDVLHKNNIPVYRFTQKPGDLVWVNVGCVHWVQALDCCNNIAWNVGPLTAKQYQMAIERYEWNKLQRYKSIVPMVHLSWNLAREVKISDPRLFELIKRCLLQTMRHSCLILQFVKSKAIEVHHHGRHKDGTPYCKNCYVEVFNTLFICARNKKIHEVYCVYCALRQSPSLRGFVCLCEYRMRTLMRIYDKFTLRMSQTTDTITAASSLSSSVSPSRRRTN